MTEQKKTLEAVEVLRDEKGAFFHPSTPESALPAPKSIKSWVQDNYSLKAEIQHVYIGEDSEEGEVKTLSDWNPTSEFEGAFLIAIFDDGDDFEAFAVFAYEYNKQNKKLLMKALAEEMDDPSGYTPRVPVQILNIWLDQKLEEISDLSKKDATRIEIGKANLTTKEEIFGFKVGLLAAISIIGDSPITIS